MRISSIKLTGTTTIHSHEVFISRRHLILQSILRLTPVSSVIKFLKSYKWLLMIIWLERSSWYSRHNRLSIFLRAKWIKIDWLRTHLSNSLTRHHHLINVLSWSSTHHTWLRSLSKRIHHYILLAHWWLKRHPNHIIVIWLMKTSLWIRCSHHFILVLIVIHIVHLLLIRISHHWRILHCHILIQTSEWRL